MQSRSRRHFLSRSGALAALGAGIQPARAKGWPDGPIRLVTTGTPGSGLDANSRALADYMAERLGVAVVVDPRPGGGGVIAMDAAARAAPDGQTLLFGVYSNYTQATVMFKKPLVDPIKTLQPIALLGTGVGPLLVRQDFPARTFKEFLAVSQERVVTFGMPILGSNSHLMMVQFARDANAKITIVPYKGAAPMMTDLAGGIIDCTITSLASAKAFMQQGRVRPILIVTGKRSQHLPDVPTWLDEGFSAPAYELKEYYLVAAPMGLPPDVATRVATLVVEATERAERVKMLRQAMIEEDPPVVGSQLEQTVRATIPAWHAAVQAAGIEPN